MARPSNAFPWALVALVSSGLLYRPSGDGSRPITASADTRTQESGSGGGGSAGETKKPKKGDDTAKKDLHRDALDVLGEHCGIDLSDEGLLARKKALMPAARAIRGTDPRDDRDILRLTALKAAACSLHVQTVIATLPDPIDSNVRWLFDPMVDAIQRAASASGYVLDRFYIPDWNPEGGADVDHSSEPVGAHERWPGVLLFRDARPDNRERAPLLMVFLVSEIATSGVHQVAFEQALLYSAMLRVLAAADPHHVDLKDLAVLGPSFSGSADSMRKTFARFLHAHPDASIRIVSGGATSPGLQGAFENDQAGKVSYRSTVLPDDILLEGLAHYLLQMDPSLDHPGTIAILHEANTSYGWGYRSPEAVGGHDKDSRIFDTAVRLPFPMHISRIRNDAQAARPRDPPKLPQAPQPQRFRSLTLQDPSTPSDQIPAFSTQLTSSSVELMLANIIDTIKRQRVRAVGLVATDARDKLFLAQQISNFAPGVMLFTIESDLLFVHPDYNKYVRGMLIASSYPLFAQNQQWAAPAGASFELQQFPTTNSEGVYNALLALIAYDINGQPRRRTAPPLLDYHPPAPDSCSDSLCVPPVWINVVASDALWPIGHSSALGLGLSVAGVQQARIAETNRLAVVRPSRSMSFLLVAFAAIALSGAVLFAYWRWGLKGEAEDFKGFNRAAKATRYQRVALAAVAVAGLPITFDCYLAWAITGPSPLPLDHLLYAIVILAEGLAIASLVVACVTPDETPASSEACATAVRVFRAVTGIALLAVAAGGIWHIGLTLWHMWHSTNWPNGYVQFAERVLQLDTGVSPIVPVVLMVLPVLCWSLLHLWRIGGPRLDSVYTSPWIADVRGRAGTGWQHDLQLAWTSPTRGLPTSFLVVVLVALVVACAVCLSIHPSTIEPAAFSQFLVAVWIIAQLCVALTLVHAVRLWSLNRDLLASIAASPLADAFGRLPHDSVYSGYLSPAPERRDLVRPARFYCALADQFPLLPANSFEPAVEDRLEKCFAELQPNLADMEYRPWSNTTVFATLDVAGGVLYDAMLTRWKLAKGGFFSREREVDTKDAVELWMLRAEEYLAMLLALVIRQLISRVMRQLLFVTLAIVLVIAALSSFPIYPIQPLMGYAWIWAAIAAAAGIWVSVTMERDPILSRLTGTPNRITWNLAFTTKLLVYAGIPVLTLFAAQFPQFGGTLLQWLAPIQPLP